MANILYTLCTTVQSDLQNSVTLTSSESEVASMATAAIVIRKLGLREQDYEQGHCTEAMPGILIVPGNRTAPPQAGVNNKDDVFYQIDLIIIDRDGNQKVAGLSTYLQWQQNIMHYFSWKTSGWPSDSDGIVCWCNATAAESLNDWRWVKMREAVSGVRLEFMSREARSS